MAKDVQKDVIARVLHKIKGKLQRMIMNALLFHRPARIWNSKLRKKVIRLTR